MVQDVGINESEGETTATEASKGCERRRSRIPASRTLPTKLCQAAALFFSHPSALVQAIPASS